MMSPEKVGICRRTSLVRDAGCSSLSTSWTRGIGLVDLVEEQDARDFLVFQLAQDELKLRDLLLVHFADDDGDVDRRQHRAHVVDELDRAGAIEKRVGVAHEIRWWRR